MARTTTPVSHWATTYFLMLAGLLRCRAPGQPLWAPRARERSAIETRLSPSTHFLVVWDHGRTKAPCQQGCQGAGLGQLGGLPELHTGTRGRAEPAVGSMGGAEPNASDV